MHTFGYLMITNHEELGPELEPIALKMNIEVPRSMGAANQQMLDQLKASNPPNDLTRWAARIVPVIREHLRLAKELQASLK